MPTRHPRVPVSSRPRSPSLRERWNGAATLAALGGVTLASAPTAVHAGADAAVEGGIFFGHAFGAPRGFHWGFELRTRIYDENVYDGCSWDPTYNSGVMTARMGAVDRDFFVEFLAGVTHQADYLSVGAQVGLGYQHGAPRPLRIPLLLDGRAVAAAIYFELDLRTGRSGAIDQGVLLPPVGGFGRYGCAIGRPMRDGHGDRVTLLGAAASAPSGGARADETALWHRSAIMEAESVPAFDLLAHDLRRARAPRSLLRRAVAAGDDEVLHAHLAAALAGQTPEVQLGGALDSLESRAGLEGDQLLARLAVESWLDGCLGEGAAAERARLESERLDDPDAQRAQRIIAADERRHAELAWDVLSWTLSVGGAPVRRALREVLEIPLAITAEVDAGEATRFGYLDQDDVARVHVDVRNESLRRAQALL